MGGLTFVYFDRRVGGMFGNVEGVLVVWIVIFAVHEGEDGVWT